MIGGGYGTGREIVEYFSRYGMLGGLLGLGITFVALALVLAVTFEFSRICQAYDYRSFFKCLLGKGWITFEILIVLQFLLVLAVLASAAGNILGDNLGMPYSVGILAMLAIVGILTFYGRDVIAKVLTFWTFVLYAVLVALFVSVFSNEQVQVFEALHQAEARSGWWRSGLKYAMYNLAVAPLLLYVARGFESRSDTVSAGIIAGALATIPALGFHLAFTSAPQAILDQAIPVYWMMARLGTTTLMIVYSVMLLGTFIETGAGMLQGINERIDGYLTEQRGIGLGPAAHAGLAVSAIAVSTRLSHWGITNLIAEGYGTMAWGFLAVYILPLLTIGIYRIRMRS
jgi:uncharacterized membrane protein YkvI